MWWWLTPCSLSFGVFCILGGVYYMLQDSVGFDNLMHGKSPKGNQKQRSLEDFGKFLATPVDLLTELRLTVFRSCLAPACVDATREVAISAVPSELWAIGERKAPVGVGRSFDFFLNFSMSHIL